MILFHFSLFLGVGNSFRFVLVLSQMHSLIFILVNRITIHILRQSERTQKGFGCSKGDCEQFDSRSAVSSISWKRCDIRITTKWSS